MTAHRAMSVGWKAKAFAFNVFDRLPFGDWLYFLFQRHVTKSLPRLYNPTSSSAEIQILQARRILERRQDVATLQLLEIGAGWDLYANLVYWCYGLERQIAVDIRRWARAETVNAAISHLAKDPPPGAVRIPQAQISREDFDGSLLALYGIRYLAPLDATRTGLAPASIDVITTTSVFEHVPAGILAGILTEFRRIIRPDGMMSHTIDFTDHYSHADPAISDFNYLRFGAQEWQRYNPGIHYQNRLRSSDYADMLHDAGFEIVQRDEWGGRPSELDRTPVHADFSRYARDELLTIGANFVVAPAL